MSQMLSQYKIESEMFMYGVFRFFYNIKQLFKSIRPFLCTKLLLILR